MGPAAEKLQQRKWQDALPDEQKALQHLLRAEATFRQIQVAFGNGGGGGGAGGGAGRDLASLFDLELDTEKNQYETAQTAGSQSQQEKDIDEALQKLDQLARRQEELAQQQRNSTQSSEQRWQQEMLRRQAEELQRQMEQMARNNSQSGSQSSSQQGGSQGNSSSGSSGQSGSGQSGAGGQSASGDPRVQQSLDRLRQATDDMRRATSPQQSEAEARRAADRLKEATDLLGGMRQQQTSSKVDSLAQEASRLAGEEREQSDRIRQMFGQGGGFAGQSAGPKKTRRRSPETFRRPRQARKGVAGHGARTGGQQADRSLHEIARCPQRYAAVRSPRAHSARIRLDAPRHRSQREWNGAGNRSRNAAPGKRRAGRAASPGRGSAAGKRFAAGT